MHNHTIRINNNKFNDHQNYKHIFDHPNHAPIQCSPIVRGNPNNHCLFTHIFTTPPKTISKHQSTNTISDSPFAKSKKRKTTVSDRCGALVFGKHRSDPSENRCDSFDRQTSSENDIEMTVFPDASATNSVCRSISRTLLNPAAIEGNFDGHTNGQTIKSSEVVILVTAETSSSASDGANSTAASQPVSAKCRSPGSRQKRRGRHKNQSHSHNPAKESANALHGRDNLPQSDGNVSDDNFSCDHHRTRTLNRRSSSVSAADNTDDGKEHTSRSRLDDLVVNICKLIF